MTAFSYAHAKLGRRFDSIHVVYKGSHQPFNTQLDGRWHDLRINNELLFCWHVASRYKKTIRLSLITIYQPDSPRPHVVIYDNVAKTNKAALKNIRNRIRETLANERIVVNRPEVEKLITENLIVETLAL